MKKIIEAVTSRLVIFTAFMIMAIAALVSPEKALKAVDAVFAKVRESQL